jgi:alkylation response protein AidB-like acyl-CoA dehydrogenase
MLHLIQMRPVVRRLPVVIQWQEVWAEWVVREAMQIHGGMGYAEEYAVSRYFVDARVFSIFEGAEEVMALRVCARDLLAQALGQS